MEGTIFSLIPAVLMLILVVSTRKIFLSLGVGIITGALLISRFNIIEAIIDIITIFRNIFYSPEDGLNMGNFYLLGFLLLLGILTAIMAASGGSQAFGHWASNRVRTRRGSQLVPACLGVLIFVDDYFNALSVGQVSRPVTDRQRISRAKLAYIIDSTSAPITVITPISSWGAYIIGTMGGIFAANEIIDYQPLEAFIRMIPLNMYAFASMLMVFIVAWFNLNIGSMKIHEDRAVQKNQLVDPENGSVAGDLKQVVEPHKDGKVFHLIVPIVTLIIATVLMMLWTGYLATEEAITVFSLFANTDVNISLFFGGLIAVVLSFILYHKQSRPKHSNRFVIIEGINSMMPAIYILILAWMIGDVIDTLDTGGYLASLVNDFSFNIHYLPLILFVIAGFMALATGTSWGTFGIMLPIAAQVAVEIGPAVVLPAMAAVLAGSVFGDHCSPISDTSILSSTGAGSHHIDHVLTQLPYAFISAIASIIGYFVFAWTEMAVVSLLATLMVVVVISVIISFITDNRP
ncbi:Na+/H+ antiporter NhaC family protein [Amphibacillus cookii]|uniref:Na+/H+ antiporter NhaC family protein n=1 Tax=Amphibacillus cookii TaxID=767787 RepID=UPI00195EE507|nr:Na+/H+ antiporter NhaC family protein [Amphibacillus cookii]MBM7541446.1 Na+/H+ antiporter NhaC [Amphibacillus cookii]